MILNVHFPGASGYEIGDEIWQQPLEEAISAEAETIADYAGPALLPSPSQAQRAALRLPDHDRDDITADPGR